MTGFARDSTTSALRALSGTAACVEARNAPATTTCPVNGFGLDAARSVSFSPDGLFAVDDIDDVVAHLRNHGGELVGEIAQYEDIYRLCFLRGPEGIIIGLAEELTARAADRTRTDDPVFTRDVLYQLSYGGRRVAV